MAESPLNFRESLSSQYLPKFKDPALELRYRQHNIRVKQKWIRVGCIVGIVLFLAVEPLARIQLPKEVLAFDHVARWYLQVPMLLVALTIAMKSENVRLVESALLLAVGTALFSTTVLLWLGGPQAKDFYSIAILQLMVFGFFVLGLRFKPAFLCLLIIVGLYIVVYSQFQYAATFVGMVEQFPGGIVVLFLGLAFAAYSVDISARTAFLSTLALNREYEERLTLQSERNKWLQVISDFLRHELKNSLIGVTSSLELIRRRNRNADLASYVERAEKSTRFMKRLLDEASASTSLESALDNIQLERFELSNLVEDKLVEYREMYPDYTFQFNTEDALYVSCDVDRMVQVLDKLINNAVEHGDSSFPLVITLGKVDGTVILKVADIGDPLVSDELDIFEPFVSRKARSSEEGFGFGLYVVKRVVEAHGGTVSARGLDNPGGAEFTISLPESVALRR